MRKRKDNGSDDTTRSRARLIHMAYTLNNHQPVRCTLIGDQPLFFMDYEGALEEEGDEFFPDFLEHDDESLDRQSARVSLFLEDSAFACAPAASASVTSTDNLAAAISKSRFGAALLQNAQQHGTGISYKGSVSSAQYDRPNNTIFINPQLSETDQILLLGRELRRVWQHRQGALIHPLTFHPDQAVLVNRAQSADLAAALVRVAWELQLSGNKDAWQRLEDSSLADLTRAFAREAYLDFRTITSGEASAAAFEAWFLSERCRTEDRRLIQYMLADYSGFVFEGVEPGRQVTAELITALGSMPFGKNYLAPYVKTIMSDALFTEVRDRSNANFLWFIKFERSFRETEQELQTGSAVPSSLKDAEFHNKNNTRFGEHEKKADIIALPPIPAHMQRERDGANFGSKATNNRESSGGNVVAFRSKKPRSRA